MELIEKLQQGNWKQKVEYYKLGNDEISMYKRINYVPNYQELKDIILK
jgi:hypothetical protein